MNLSNAESIRVNGKEIRTIEINGKVVWEKVSMTLTANKEFIVSDEVVTIGLESDLQEKEVELFKVIGMTRTSLGSKTTGSDGTASWSYTGTGAGTVGFVAVYDDKDSNTVTVDDYTPVVSSIGLTADKSAIISGQSVLLTATVEDQHSQSISSGTVTFKVNGTSVGTGSISSGVATLTTSAFSSGVNQVTAEVGSVSSDIVNVSVVGIAVTLGLTGNQLNIRSNAFTYTGAVTVDWGDGTTSDYTGEALNHTYASSGDYEVEINGNITGLKKDAFAYQTITSATIGSSITSLGRYCFGSTNLTSLTIPKTVTSIGIYCFGENDALTEIVLNWDTASSIITYDADWIMSCSSFDHFLIPQGTTSLYTAKNYPSALLQEQGGVEPASIDFTLTAGKSILSYADVSGGNEYATLTATVYDEDDNPLEGVDVNLYNGATLWDTLTTGSDGTVSKTYTSQGSGDITFTAEVDGTLLTKTFVVQDCIKYISSVSKTFSTSSVEWYNIADLGTGLGDCEITFKMKANQSKSFRTDFSVNNQYENKSRHIIEITTEPNYKTLRTYDSSGNNTNQYYEQYTTNTDVECKFHLENGNMVEYIDGNSKTFTALTGLRYLGITNWNIAKTVTITDLKVKPL